jgi:hypothetical protein
MKIVSFTMVNNESEIIESFIRYNYNFLDEMYIIDNGCTDNTIKILHNLKNDGYKIVIYDESLEAYDQFRLDNKYLNKIIEESNPDLIIPLDADEFIISDHKDPRKEMEKLSLDKIYYVNWQWYVMTEKDDPKETFIPRRLKYCLKRTVWNYSDGTPVTKVILPARYFKEKKLTMSMGHHTVYGDKSIAIEEINNIKLAHYRAISEEQLVYKTCCYTMRDIATMGNNIETAQRTNQLAKIESGISMHDAAIEASYAGYPKEITENQIDLSFCEPGSLTIKYSELSSESIAERIMRTGQEMAIRSYNLERKIKEYMWLEPIVLWLDGIRKTDVFLPDPSNESTFLVAKYNVRAYLTMQEEIKFLKCNYRLLVNPEQVKFIPHQFIVVPSTCDVEDVRMKLHDSGFSTDMVISVSEYRKKLGLIKCFYSDLLLIPGMIVRIKKYIGRNGINGTIKKIRKRLKKG